MRTMTLVLVVLTCLPFLTKSIAAAENAVDAGLCSNIDLNWLRAHAPIPRSEIVSRRVVEDLCEVMLKIGSDLVPIYAGKNFLLAGELYSHRRQITQDVIGNIKKAEFKKSINKIEKIVAFEYQPPNANGTAIYMISDPLCGYCEKAAAQIGFIANKYGVTVKTILFNVHGEQGKEKCLEAICRNFDLDQYVAPGWKKAPGAKDQQCKKGFDLYNDSIRQIRKLGIRGVPAFFLDDGTRINGADMAALEKELKNKIRGIQAKIISN